MDTKENKDKNVIEMGVIHHSRMCTAIGNLKVLSDTIQKKKIHTIASKSGSIEGTIWCPHCHEN